MRNFYRLVLLRHEILLHRAGISHGDVASRNFVKGPRGIRLIDFDRSKPHSVCPVYEVYPDIPMLDAEAASQEQPCDELDNSRKWFGFCERWDLSSKQWARFVPWDGPPWGSDAHLPAVEEEEESTTPTAPTTTGLVPRPASPTGSTEVVH